MLASGTAQIDEPDTQHGRTPLQLAAFGGKHDMVAALLAAGVDVNARDRVGQEAIHMAVCQRGGEPGMEGNAVIESLLAAKASILARDEIGYTPLHMAALNHNADAIRLLMRFKADPALSAGCTVSSAHTSIHIAASTGSDKCLDALLSRGEVPDVPDDLQQTPLMLACLGRHTAAVRALLDAKASLTAKDFGWWNPLHFASVSGALPVAQVLLNARASVERKSDPGKRSCVHLAAGAGHHAVLELLLLHQGEVPNPRLAVASTPLVLGLLGVYWMTFCCVLQPAEGKGRGGVGSAVGLQQLDSI